MLRLLRKAPLKDIKLSDVGYNNSFCLQFFKGSILVTHFKEDISRKEEDRLIIAFNGKIIRKILDFEHKQKLYNKILEIVEQKEQDNRDEFYKL